MHSTHVWHYFQPTSVRMLLTSNNRNPTENGLTNEEASLEVRQFQGWLIQQLSSIIRDIRSCHPPALLFFICCSLGLVPLMVYWLLLS